ncbi:MAG: DUF2236 domain-containing protein [Sandaracinaceae bacterium]|jgi:hypothetical protein|nr:DUF2236 domain-containing protein [Sandaracinaceae bacterium]MBK7156133.1 DUF2236 domain-containing protein [Sandaracinaceae bacterium]MBK7775432.1 DUF2236 domain-containing protein [Sandaracinaceae bacterium]
MTISLAALKAQVRSQKTLIPSLYGGVDFETVPERFTRDPNVQSMLPGGFAAKYRGKVLADTDSVERMLAYTMLGDVVADAYAALIPQYGFKRLIDMLVSACQHGIESVPDAPPELERFIASMEKRPDWIDPKLSAQGARAERVSMALFVPFVIRGAFIATFLNKYSGLPMAMTGTLSDDSAVQRVKETASFFTTASLPGALDRFGAGFRAAAMVRLMHSMVRMNLLVRSGRWDVATYGIPIPQVDQMPAGTMPAFVTAYRAVHEKRGFTRRERAVVEHCRHQCFLLGLPPELLLETPQDIFDSMLVYTATLRDGYDDATNGALVRATMSAYLPESHELPGRIQNALERSISKVFFRHTFRVPTDKVRMMGMVPSPLDYAIFTAFQAYVWPTLFAHMAAERIPVVEGMADRWLVKRIDELLVSYGHAEYTTDPSKYAVARPSHGASPMPHMRPATV